jgi:hypothetical protein
MSILFAIARVARPTQRLFRLFMGFAIFFFLMWGGFIVQKARNFESSSDWYQLPCPSCRIDRSMAAYQLASRHHTTFSFILSSPYYLISQVCR